MIYSKKYMFWKKKKLPTKNTTYGKTLLQKLGQPDLDKSRHIRQRHCKERKL